MSVNRSPAIPLIEFLVAEAEEIVSPLNQWGAGEEFGYQPKQWELLLHYVHCGRAEQFAAAYSDDNIWFASQALGCNILALSSELRKKVLIAFYDLWQEAIQNWAKQKGQPFIFEDFK